MIAPRISSVTAWMTVTAIIVLRFLNGCVKGIVMSMAIPVGIPMGFCFPIYAQECNSWQSALGRLLPLEWLADAMYHAALTQGGLHVGAKQGRPSKGTNRRNREPPLRKNREPPLRKNREPPRKNRENNWNYGIYNNYCFLGGNY